MFGFLNRDAISDQKMPFFHTLIRSRGFLENHTRFQTTMVKVISVFWPKGLKKPSLWGGTYLYSW